MYVLALGGPALDYTVMLIEHEGRAKGWLERYLKGGGQRFVQSINDSPSRNWEQGGPIIERERICIEPSVRDEHYWYARKLGRNGNIYGGMTPLEAAMRCYVSSTLGEDVDIPEELV